MRRKRIPPRPPQPPEGYVTVTLANGEDNVVPEHLVREDSIDQMWNKDVPTWRNDPTYNLRKKK